MRATGMRLRLNCPDLGLAVNIAASRDPDSHIEWTFEERPGWENIASMLIWVRMPLRPESAGNSCFTQSPVNWKGTR